MAFASSDHTKQKYPKYSIGEQNSENGRESYTKTERERDSGVITGTDRKEMAEGWRGER